ncbi:MAG: aminotransferase class V-fold PLP-dependent enzyme, partial [Clostridia bacterium]|nr:aminotransferase class V-fold PLP-dependent enzyme [Clostridia bacterium]
KANRSVGISNVYFDGYSGPSIVMFLDMNKICVSSGSACTSGSEQPSIVITSIYDENRAKSSVRFSFSFENTKEEVDIVISKLKEFIK